MLRFVSKFKTLQSTSCCEQLENPASYCLRLDHNENNKYPYGKGEWRYAFWYIYYTWYIRCNHRRITVIFASNDNEHWSRRCCWCIASRSLDNAQFKTRKLGQDLTLSQYAILYTMVICRLNQIWLTCYSTISNNSPLIFSKWLFV